jgi:hypothetical protein
MGAYCKRPERLAEIARTKNSLGYLMPCSVAESVRVIAIVKRYDSA